MAPEEISNLEAVAIYGISKVELFTNNDGQEYHRPVFWKMITVTPIPSQAQDGGPRSQYNRILRFYKNSFNNPELAETEQPIELGKRIAIKPETEKILKLKIDDYELRIHARDTRLTISRKTFESKDPKILEKEVNQYLSGCLKYVS